MNIITKCKDCAFAKWSPSKEQNGCVANRLDKFENKGKVEDDGVTYYEIRRVCNMYRDGDSILKYGEADISDVAKKVRQESSLNYDLLIKTTDANYLAVLDTVASFSQLEPKKIRVIYYGGHAQYREMLKNTAHIKNLLTTYLFVDYSYFDCFHHIMQRQHNAFFLYCNAGFINNGAIEWLDKQINDEMIPVTKTLYGDDFIFGLSYIYEVERVLGKINEPSKSNVHNTELQS